MPAIIRLRVSEETTSAIDDEAKRRLKPRAVNRCRLGLLLGQCDLDVSFQRLGDELNNWHYNRIAELAICLSVRNADLEFPIAALKTHKPCALPGCQTARTRSRLLYQYFRSVLVVAGRERPGHIVGAEEAVSETI